MAPGNQKNIKKYMKLKKNVGKDKVIGKKRTAKPKKAHRPAVAKCKRAKAGKRIKAKINECDSDICSGDIHNTIQMDGNDIKHINKGKKKLKRARPYKKRAKAAARKAAKRVRADSSYVSLDNLPSDMLALLKDDPALDSKPQMSPRKLKMKKECLDPAIAALPRSILKLLKDDASEIEAQATKSDSEQRHNFEEVGGNAACSSGSSSVSLSNLPSELLRCLKDDQTPDASTITLFRDEQLHKELVEGLKSEDFNINKVLKGFRDKRDAQRQHLDGNKLAVLDGHELAGLNGGDEKCYADIPEESMDIDYDGKELSNNDEFSDGDQCSGVYEYSED